MSSHFPVLQVVVPLLAAPLCVLIRNKIASRVIATLAVLFCVYCAANLLMLTADGDVLSYAMGSWQPPVGIEYRVDRLNALVALIVSVIAAASLAFGTSGADARVREREGMFLAAFLLCLTGLLGMAMTGDAFNVFVFLEISSLSTYTLVAMGKSRRSFTAAFNYLVLGTVGGTFLLIGIGLLYQMTGTLNMRDIAERMPAVVAAGPRTVLVAFAFFFVGLTLKLAVFPLHQWLPNTYAEAPSGVSAFLAGTATKVVYYQLIRVIFGMFGAAFVFQTEQIGRLMIPLSIAAMFFGSLAAVYQTSLKRLLAYSSIGQVGYLTLALSFGTEAGVTAGVLHLGAHALTKAGLFLVVACIVTRLGTDKISSLHGLARRMPISFALFVVGGIGLIGVPGTAGFVSKWYLVSAALQGGHNVVAVMILLSSLIAVIYVWRIVEIGYFKSAAEGEGEELQVREASPRHLLPAAALLGASIYFGLSSTAVVKFAQEAAAQILGGLS